MKKNEKNCVLQFEKNVFSFVLYFLAGLLVLHFKDDL
jgi:hypothetical protein